MEKKTFTPIVITSRKAKKKLEHIKSTHADLVQGMTMQADKVKLWQEQKKMEALQQQQVDFENNKVKTDQENQVRKEQMAHEKEMSANQLKMAEIEMKRKALEEPKKE